MNFFLSFFAPCPDDVLRTKCLGDSWETCVSKKISHMLSCACLAEEEKH